jgi:catechol 2,3-dioxygenase-like lactoylglutathione lyase family enzyme
MFTHIALGANDLEVSTDFYDATLGTLGVPAGVEDAKGRIVYAHNGGRLLLTKPVDGEAACHANGGTIGFAAASPAAADAWHAAGLAHGGSTCEDPPGVRETPVGKLYLAYLRDPAGNKLCVVHRMPA